MIKEYIIIHKEDDVVLDVVEKEEDLAPTLEILEKTGFKDKIHVEEWIIND